MPPLASSVDEEVQRLSRRLEALEARVQALERAPREAGGGDGSPGRDLGAPFRSPRSPFDPLHLTTNLGRALIVLGGAYLLRALTEAGTWPPSVGAALGLVYALAWTATSVSAARAGHRVRASFDGGVSLAIGFPLLVEASLKFDLFPAPGSAGVLGAFTAVALAAASRARLPEVGWLAGIGGAVTGLVLMVRTGAAPAYSIYFTGLGVAAFWLGEVRNWIGLRWPLGIAAAFAVLGVTLQSVARPPVASAGVAWASQGVLFAAYLGSVAVRTLVRGRPVIVFEVAQTLLVVVVALGGALAVANAASRGGRVLGVAALALGVGTYVLALRFVARMSAAALTFQFYGSLALVLVTTGISSALDGAARAVALTATGVALATAWSRSSRLTLGMHTAIVLIAASWASGLVSLGLAVFTGALPTAGAAEWPALAAFIVVLVLSTSRLTACRQPGLAWSDVPAMALGLVASTGLAGFATLGAAAMIDAVSSPVAPDLLATLRTAALSALAIGCARLPRTGRLSAMSRLAYPLLIVAGLKLVAVDLRTSRASTLFAALAFYGAALLLVPRLRRTA